MGSTQSSASRIKSNETSEPPASRTTTNTTTNLGPPYPIVGSNDIMRKKQHGTSHTPVQQDLRWNCDVRTADRICNYNRHNAEYSGYFTSRKSSFLKECASAQKHNRPLSFYDSNTGKLLFTAPVNRSWDAFLAESRSHGWPSFRDDEVHWENVRCLTNGECVSLDGTHLGHNLPDHKGNRYCINLVSVAGRPIKKKKTTKAEGKVNLEETAVVSSSAQQ